MNYNSQYHGIPANKVFRTKRCVRMTKNGKEIIKEQGHIERNGKRHQPTHRPTGSQRTSEGVNEWNWMDQERKRDELIHTPYPWPIANMTLEKEKFHHILSLLISTYNRGERVACGFAADHIIMLYTEFIFIFFFAAHFPFLPFRFRFIFQRAIHDRHDLKCVCVCLNECCAGSLLHVWNCTESVVCQ